MYVSKHVCMFETVNHRHVKLSWNRKNPHRQRGFGRVSSSLGRCMLNIHTCMLNIHTCSTYIHTCSTYIHTCSGIHMYVSYVCLRCLSMYVCLQACMYVWDRKSSSQGWVRFLTENLQYWTFYSIFWDLWGGVLPEALTYISVCEDFKKAWSLLTSVTHYRQKPSQAEGFWNIPVLFFIFVRAQIVNKFCMYVRCVCMYVQNPRQAEGFWTYIHGPRTYIQNLFTICALMHIT